MKITKPRTKLTTETKHKGRRQFTSCKAAITRHGLIVFHNSSILDSAKHSVVGIMLEEMVSKARQQAAAFSIVLLLHHKVIIVEHGLSWSQTNKYILAVVSAVSVEDAVLRFDKLRRHFARKRWLDRMDKNQLSRGKNHDPEANKNQETAPA